MFDLTNTEEIKKFFKRYNLTPNKFMGQNFLVDKAVLGKIVAAAEISKGDNVLEIGPGLGTLTRALIEAGARVLAIEKDKELIPVLKENLREFKNACGEQSRTIKIINADFLKLDVECPSGHKVVSNLPYYITSPVIRKILSRREKPKLAVFLAQKEVAERICAEAGQMSFISVFTQFYGEPEIIAAIKPPSFWPKPKVGSAILKIVQREKAKIPGSEENELWRLVKIGFSCRRKTLANNLSAGLRLPRGKIEEVLKTAGFSGKVRAQELGVDGWVRLVKKLRGL